MSVTDRFAELQAAEAEAARHAADLAARLRGEWRLGAELLRPWRPTARKPDTDRLRRWTADLIARIERDGLAFENNQGRLAVIDPDLRDEHAAAQERLRAAQAERQAFERAHASALKAEADAAEAQRIRDALRGDDPAAIKAALA